MQAKWRIDGLALGLGMLATIGCGGPPPAVELPRVDPQGAAQRAMEKYDHNGDGALDKSELAAAPSLQSALPRIDGDGDGRIRASELSKRIADWQVEQTGMTPFEVKVIRGGKPLENAQVVFEPAEFLGEVFQRGEGVSDKDGLAIISIPPELRKPGQEAVEGITAGLYRVRVTHPSEALPAKFNTETTLGCEVAYDLLGGEPPTFELR